MKTKATLSRRALLAAGAGLAAGTAGTAAMAGVLGATPANPEGPFYPKHEQADTDADGRYAFTTIKPGAYRVGGNWTRPPHIHFRVSRRGYHEFTTQMYFEGDFPVVLARVG